MTLVVNPHIPLSSAADRDKYLFLIQDVARETQENEPQCLAYCWTTPVEESDRSVDSPALVQGLEVYATEEALAVTHRSGKAYKHMREVVASTGLLSYPKGGVPTYRPAGGGFLSKPGVPETVGSEEYFVLVKYIVRGGDAVSRVLREERQLADELKGNEGVFAVWSFVPEGRNDDDEEGVSIALFIRLRGVADYAGAVEECVSQFERRVSREGIEQTMFWGGHGFGFLRQ
ncbi:hypothetical protein BJX68DRAFT_264962 [Aspergillus pseudodeflectus]|uniref:ABM domain-containing protein n=1 Tax=Aspergillus pseudodeflectus TaxID=176178 RepID=A0ABR4KMI8_9EURO